MLTLSPLQTVEEALELASIRNECRLQMTNDQQEISVDQQVKWFENTYQKQSTFKIWLLKDQNQIVGYFAAKEEPDGIYITEGLKASCRGKGYGTFMLKSMLSPGKTFYADIFNHNTASIKLHEKFGFHFNCLVKENVSRFTLKC